METIFSVYRIFIPSLFKSYYVVWKLLSLNQIFIYCVSFKSYYVVWKRHFNILFCYLKSRLNRTMQYGNNILPKKIIFPFLSLNRTMQYGNLYTSSRKKKYSHCLNRTMQYGNQYSCPVLSHTRDAFKSYYVVWKLSSSMFSIVVLFVFKSYYVVWKPNANKYFVTQYRGLNRTMQYGNKDKYKQ